MTTQPPERPSPCPHCGGAGRSSNISRSVFGIRCNDCGAGTDIFDTEAEAIAAWNRRTPTSKPQAQRIAELEAENAGNRELAEGRLAGWVLDKRALDAAEAKLAAQPSSALDGEVVERVKRDIEVNDMYSDDYRTDEIMVSKADLRALLAAIEARKKP